MVNLKKYKVLFQNFGLFLTLLVVFSCNSHKMTVTKVEGKLININKTNNENKEVEDYIKPYREKIDADLNAVLAIAPQTLDKSGLWQSTIGNLLADVTLQKGNVVFNKRENKSIDICLLNFGGIRAIINKGEVTARTAFEIMPFENSLIVVALNGTQILEIVDYLIITKKAQPLSGITFTISKSKIAKNILVQGKPVEPDKIYYVATSDYLSNGGDNMIFFKNGSQFFDLNYKLRNILIDYFKDVDSIPLINDIRITAE